MNVIIGQIIVCIDTEIIFWLEMFFGDTDTQHTACRPASLTVNVCPTCRGTLNFVDLYNMK